MRANPIDERERRRTEFERKIVRGGVQDIVALQRRIERGRPRRSLYRSQQVTRYAPPATARVASAEWDLSRVQAGGATYRRIRAAVKAAASSGKETVLTASTELPAEAAVAYAEQYMPLERIRTVDVDSDGNLVVIHPQADSKEDVYVG